MTNSFQLLPNSGFERFLLDSQAPLVSECLEAPAESVADSYAIGLSVSQRDSCYWARMAARFQLLEYAVENWLHCTIYRSNCSLVNFHFFDAFELLPISEWLPELCSNKFPSFGINWMPSNNTLNDSNWVQRIRA